MSSNMEKLSWCPTRRLTPTEYYLWLGKVLHMLRRRKGSVSPATNTQQKPAYIMYHWAFYAHTINILTRNRERFCHLTESQLDKSSPLP